MNPTNFSGVQPCQTRFRQKPSSLLIFVRDLLWGLLGTNLFISTMAYAVAEPSTPAANLNKPVVVTTTYSMPNTVNIETTKPKPKTPALHFTYPSAIRLEQVLADSLSHLPQLPVPDELNNQPIYWQGAGLYTRFPDPNKATVLTSLGLLADRISSNSDSNSVHDHAIIQSLQQTLSELAIGERIFTPLDYDAVRITASANPLITQSVTLVLPPRPTDILVLGAVEKSGFQTWLPRQAADFYLAQAHPSSQGMTQAVNSYATVIQPDGQVETHTIAYWNQNHQDIAPGATVYLNFADLPSRFTPLNDEIVTLLRNRSL